MTNSQPVTRQNSLHCCIVKYKPAFRLVNLTSVQCPIGPQVQWPPNSSVDSRMNPFEVSTDNFRALIQIKVKVDMMTNFPKI